MRLLRWDPRLSRWWKGRHPLRFLLNRRPESVEFPRLGPSTSLPRLHRWLSCFRYRLLILSKRFTAEFLLRIFCFVMYLANNFLSRARVSILNSERNAILPQHFCPSVRLSQHAGVVITEVNTDRQICNASWQGRDSSLMARESLVKFQHVKYRSGRKSAIFGHISETVGT